MSAFNLDAFIDLFDQASDDAQKRADIVAMARMAETAERYEDMCQFIKYLVSTLGTQPLTVEERNLLSVAYKNVIGTRRASWRTLSAEAESSDADSANVKKYNKIVEVELEDTCTEVLKILEDLIQHTDDDPEASVFYLKMAGDYYRYLAESVTDSREFPEKANKYYKDAYEKATQPEPKGLVPTHPVRLGLALNYSVCHYEILKNKTAACELAKTAFDDAIAKLDKLAEKDYKDSTLIMQLLRDNLTLWTSNDNDGEGVQVEDLSDEEN